MNKESLTNEVKATRATKEQIPKIIEVIKKGYDVAYKEGAPSAPPYFSETYSEDVESGKIRLFVTSLDGIIVGSVQYHDRDGVAFISQMTVDPEQRKMGIGAKLIRLAEESAKGEGFESIRLTAMVEKDLPRYYEKLGYKEIELKKRPRYTLVLMEKQL